MTETQEFYLLPGERLTVIGAEPPPVPEPGPPWTDMRADFPVNSAPDDPYFVANRLTDWWHRAGGQLDIITIHHTLSHNPLGIANYITRPVHNGGKGRPTTEYTFWVSIEGAVLYCVDIARGVWHDHTGHRNTHISVGLAGRWDYEQPPLVQLRACAALCLHLMAEYPSIQAVRGHSDFYATACPGWNNAGWRNAFYALLSPAVSFALAGPMPRADYDGIFEAE